MEKEKLYHIALDDYEHGVVIRSLNDEKTKLMEEGKSADAVDAVSYTHLGSTGFGSKGKEGLSFRSRTYPFAYQRLRAERETR